MRRLSPFIFCLVCLLAPVASAEGNSVPLSPVPFAIMGPAYSHMHQDPDALERGERSLQLLELTGARWTRRDFWWSVVQPDRDTWNWDYFDQAFESYRKHRINPLVILCYGSSWYKEAPATEEEMQLFGEYVYRMVDRYKYWVKHWEIWNEPNILPFWAPKPNVAHYTRLLQIAYQRAKEADPECVILGGSTAGADYAFLRGMYEHGAKGYFDVFSYHTYGNNPTKESQQREIDVLLEVMREYDDVKPLWLTETGIYTGPAGLSLPLQAERIIKSEIRWVAMGIEQIHQLTLKDWTDDPQTLDATSFRGFTHADGTPKPSFYAHRTLCDLLGDKPFLGSPPLHPELDAYLFGNEYQNVLALWAEEEQEVETTLDLGVHSILMYDLYGNRSLLRSETGNFSLQIGQAPVYLEGVQDQVILMANLQVECAVEAVALGDRARLNIIARNPFSDPLELEAIFPDTPQLSFKPGRVSIRLAPGESATPFIEVLSAPDAEIGIQSIAWQVQSEPFGTLSLFGELTLESPYEVRFQPFNQIELPESQLELMLVNRSTRKVEARLEFDFPEVLKTPPATQLTLEAGAQHPIPVVLNLEQLQSGVEYSLQAHLHVEGVKSTAETVLRVLKVFPLESPIQIDGKLDDWERYPRNIRADMLTEVKFNPNLIGGPDDLTASGWLAWDEEALYLTLEVFDDHIHLPSSTVIWNHDSLQVGIDGMNDAIPGKGYDYNDFEFEIALLDNGEVLIYAGHYPEGQIATIVEEECDVAITADFDTGRMVYEVRIPQPVIPPVRMEAGRVFGFSFIINDNDSGQPYDRAGWLELTPGIGFGKEPHHFYHAILWQ